MVVIEGFEGGTDLGELPRYRNPALGTGGILKEGHIELQSAHEEPICQLHDEYGYSAEG